MKTILLVEDDFAVAALLCSVLEDEGYRVTRAENGLQGLNSIKTIQPDLVVCDMMMPILDGMEMCRAMRASPANSHIPFIMVSAAYEPAHTSERMYDAFFRKPIDIDIFLETIDRLIKDRER